MSNPMGKMTVDELLQNMPKMMRIADDLHNMTSYINDLRILTIVMVVAGAIGGIGFLLFKLSQASRSVDEEEPNYRRAPQYFDEDAHYRYHELQSVRTSEARALPEKVPLSKDSGKSSPAAPDLKGTPEV